MESQDGTPRSAEPSSGDIDSREGGDRHGLFTRRRVLGVGALGLGVVGLGAAGVAAGVVHVPQQIRRRFQDTGPAGTIPSAPNGKVTLVQRRSVARNQDVGFFTAVPAGYGDGAGLPVCLILHGASATTKNFEPFGYGHFVTASAMAGNTPFVLVGADGGVTSWTGDGPGGADDPQAMLREEIPSWCDALGFDTSRMAAYGWSMGGYGALLARLQHPGWLRAVSALSPAVGMDDPVSSRASEIDGTTTGIWCGTVDALEPNVRALVEKIPGGPAIASFSKGAHERSFWNRVTPDAFAFVSAALA